MRNQYNTRCHECGYWVFEGEGTVKKLFSRWLVQHDKCPAEAIQAQKRREREENAWMREQEERIRRNVMNDPKAMAYLASKGLRP